MMSGQASKNFPESVSRQVKSAMDQAQGETGKLMNSLARESEKLRDQTMRLAGETVNEAKERMGEIRGRVEDVRGKANDALNHLEQIFEDRVSRALKRLGAPTRDDLQGIARRLEDINDQIKSLTNDPQAAMTPWAAESDDLKLINGIGPALEGKLNAAGIHRYRQIIALTDADIEQLESEVIHLRGRICRDNWIGQSKELHMKKYGEAW